MFSREIRWNYFRTAVNRTGRIMVRRQYPPGAASVLILPTPPVLPEAILERKAEDLREQAKRIQDLQGRLAGSQTNELHQMLEEMTRHAAEAARTASEFPDIQLQHYFSNIQTRTRGFSTS